MVILNFMNMLKVSIVLVAIMALVGCGGSTSNSGGDSALSCVSTESRSNGVAVTNTCSEPINILSDSGDRLSLAAGETSILMNATGNTAIAACFAPSIPENLSGGSFSCS